MNLTYRTVVKRKSMPLISRGKWAAGCFLHCLLVVSCFFFGGGGLFVCFFFFFVGPPPPPPLPDCGLLTSTQGGLFEVNAYGKQISS